MNNEVNTSFFLFTPRYRRLGLAANCTAVSHLKRKASVTLYDETDYFSSKCLILLQGHHYNWSRDKCDEAFLRDALRTCRHTRGRRSLTSALLDIWYFFQGISKEERRCKLTAEFYYKLVRSFGKSHFELRDHQYCNNTCADKHGTPFENLEREFHQEKERLKISRPARSHGQS